MLITYSFQLTTCEGGAVRYTKFVDSTNLFFFSVYILCISLVTMQDKTVERVAEGLRSNRLFLEYNDKN